MPFVKKGQFGKGIWFQRAKTDHLLHTGDLLTRLKVDQWPVSRHFILTVVGSSPPTVGKLPHLALCVGQVPID